MIDRAIELIKQGLSVREASEMLNTTESNLYTVMRRNKVFVSDLRPCAKKGPVVHLNGKFNGEFSKQQVCMAIVEGFGYKGAAEILDVNHDCLKSWCRKNNIKVKQVLDSHGVKRDPETYKNQYSYQQPVKVIYEKATLRDLAIRRPWFGGSLCL